MVEGTPLCSIRVDYHRAKLHQYLAQNSQKHVPRREQRSFFSASEGVWRVHGASSFVDILVSVMFLMKT